MEAFVAERTGKSFVMHLEGSPEAVFPLLCPTVEYDWIDGWKCELVASKSGVAELDCVFKTDFPGEGPDVWVVSRYEPPTEIQFVRVDAHRTMRYAIRLSDNGDGTTTAVWDQVVTGLDAEGNVHVRSLTQAAYDAGKRPLEQMINHYLKTGRMLPRGEIEA